MTHSTRRTTRQTTRFLQALRRAGRTQTQRQPIAAVLVPRMNSVNASQTLTDAFATGVYSSLVGAITTKSVVYYVNNTQRPANWDIQVGDVLRATETVWDDKGNSRSFDTNSVTVINAASLSITGGPTAVSFAENSGANQVVGTYSANRTATWSLEGSGAGFFVLGATSGTSVTLTLSENPNFEQRAEYALTVRATAGSESVSRNLIVTITDVDENAPTITAGPTAVSIVENSGANQIVGTYVLSEAGTWSLGGADVASFSILANGNLVLVPNPDFEAKSEYSVTIIGTASDNGLTASRNLLVQITDVSEGGTNPPVTTSRSALAFGVRGVEDWDNSCPFINWFKFARPWYQGWGDAPANSYDSNRNPLVASGPNGPMRTMWAERPASEIGLTFRLEWDGVMSWGLGGGFELVSGSLNTSGCVIRVTGSGSRWLDIASVGSPRPTNLRKIDLRHIDAWNAGKVLNPDWAHLYRGLGRMRLLDPMSTNDNQTRALADRTPFTSCFWGIYQKGIPWELIPIYARETGSNMWINIPHQLDEAGITFLATYLRDNYPTDKELTVEYSNECWNTASAFTQTQWLYNRAQAEWPGSGWDGQKSMWAKMSTRALKIFKDIMGATHTLNLHVGGLVPDPSWAIGHLDASVWQAREPSTFIEPASVATEVGVTTYWGYGFFGDGGTRFNQLNSVYSASGATAAANLLADWAEGVVPGVPGNLAEIVGMIRNHRNQVKAFAPNLKTTLYEGGQHAHMAGVYANNGDPTHMAAIMAWSLSERFADHHEYMFNACRALEPDGQPLVWGPYMQYKLQDRQTPFGTWGITFEPTEAGATLALQRLNQLAGVQSGGGGQNPQPGTYRTALPLTGDVIHSGHSLTDTAMFKGTWPYHGPQLVQQEAQQLGQNSGAVAKSTIPGSAMDWRRLNAPGYGAPHAWDVMGDYDALVVTENNLTSPESLYPGTNNNRQGRRQELVTWVNRAHALGTKEFFYYTCWPNHADFAPAANWRARLVADEVEWLARIEYAELNKNTNAPKVWVVPGLKLMLRLEDDAASGLIPGIANAAAFRASTRWWEDGVHPNGLGQLALAYLHILCIYHIDPVNMNHTGFGLSHEPTTAEAAYIKDVVYDVARNYPLAGVPNLRGGATAPVITSGQTSFNINENTPVPQVIGTYTADRAVTWSVAGADANAFSITAGGVLSLIEPPDFETQSSYSVSVVATAGGLSASRNVAGTIGNVDEGGGSNRLADFVNGIYNGISPSCSRAASGWAETTTAGQLTAFGANTLRRTNKGLLVEPSASNDLLQSVNQAISPWGASGTMTRTANAGVAPDGTSSATRIQTSGTGALSQTISAGSRRFGIWARSNTGATQRVGFWTGAASVEFDLTTTWQFLDFGLLTTTAWDFYGVGETPLDILVWQPQAQPAGAPGASPVSTAASSATRDADVVSFVIPAGVTQLTFTFDNDTTQNVAVTPGATYQIPTNLNRRYIKFIDANASVGGGTPVNPPAGVYVSSAGSDTTGDGSFSNPYRTVAHAWAQATAGQTVWLLTDITLPNSGTAQGLILSSGGTSGNFKRLAGYPLGTRRAVDLGLQKLASWGGSGIRVSGAFIEFNSILIRNLVYDPAIPDAQYIDALNWRGTDGRFINSEIAFINGRGLTVGEGGNATGFYALNSDFHDCRDPRSNYGDADGVQVFTDPGETGVTFEYCRFWNNSDDGIDLFFADEPVTIFGCWAFGNGFRENGITAGGDGVGFKFGGIQTPAAAHLIERCLSHGNRYMGADSNGNDVGSTVRRCTFIESGSYSLGAYDNGVPVQIIENVKYGAPLVVTGSAVVQTRNSWNTPPGIGAENSNWFQSLNPAGLTNARAADGSLPLIAFARPAAGSPLLTASGTGGPIGAFDGPI